VCLAVTLLVTATGVTVEAAVTNVPPVNQPLEGPQATLEQLAQGYRGLSPDAVIATFSADYRFHSFGDSLASFMSGSSREDEAEVVRRMLMGERRFKFRRGMIDVPRADSVGMRLDGIREGVDPEHADSSQHYRVLTVSLFEMGFRTTNGERYLTASREHIFHLVRGDVASLASGQPATAGRWYIRRWLEDVAGVRERLERERGECGEPPAPTAGPRSRGDSPIAVTALAIRPLVNPACAKLEVTCDFPGREPARIEVYDVSGRLVVRRELAVPATGTLTLEAGRGARVVPGVYWLRLGQGPRPPTTRMVVVAR
jgi:hypothetical protein